MDHFSGNKRRIGSIEVPIDGANPGALPVNQCQIAIKFYGRGWPSVKKCKKKHFRVQIGRIGGATQSQNFIARPYHRSI
jgi:hypothetical protein